MSSGGPPDPSMICLYPEMLNAAQKQAAASDGEGMENAGQMGGGPPDPSMICLYPEMLQAAVNDKGNAVAQDEGIVGGEGPPDPSMVCLYPDMLKAAREAHN